MEKLQSTARKLDIFFRIVHIFITVALVASLVGMAIIGAYFLFDLSPAMIGTGYGSVAVSPLPQSHKWRTLWRVPIVCADAVAHPPRRSLCLSHNQAQGLLNTPNQRPLHRAVEGDCGGE